MVGSTGTHFSKYAGKMATRTSGFPTSPANGEQFYNTTDNIYYRYSASDEKWWGVNFTTTTSTSTSTTTTSTSTSSSTTTSTSTSTTTTSTSTSVTTTSTSTSTTTTV